MVASDLSSLTFVPFGRRREGAPRLGIKCDLRPVSVYRLHVHWNEISKHLRRYSRLIARSALD